MAVISTNHKGEVVDRTDKDAGDSGDKNDKKR